MIVVTGINILGYIITEEQVVGLQLSTPTCPAVVHASGHSSLFEHEYRSLYCETRTRIVSISRNCWYGYWHCY